MSAFDDIFKGFEVIRVDRDPSIVPGTVWTNPFVVAFLQDIFRGDDPRPAVEQANDRYAHGGGWRPFAGFEMTGADTTGGAAIHYPGDPAMRELSRCTLNTETLILFEYGWVAVLQPDGSFVIARMD